MPDILVIAYPWLKTLHILSVILWLGAQMLLPGLLAAHCGQPQASPQSVLLLRIAQHLIRRILNPAMLAAFVFGTLLAVVVINTAGQLPLWLGLKFVLIFVLATLHGKLLRQFRRASEGGVQWTLAGYRFVQWLNFVLLTGVVGLVVAKPFW